MTLVLRDGKKATLYGVGAAELGVCGIGQRLLIRDDLESGDHVPVAALGIVSKLPDCVPRRYAFDTLLLGHNVPVASNDEDFGVSHIWKRCIHPNTQKRLWKVLQTQNILAKRKDPIAGNQKTCTATEKQFLESQRNPRNRRNAREHISHADVFIP